MDLLPDFEAYITRHRLLQPGDGVVVGVSGGADSVVLLDLLDRLAPAWQLRLHVAHLHHGIRGSDADADAAFVEALAARRNRPCTVGRENIPAEARRQSLALEETARRVRYAFLAQVARAQGAGRIAVGHHADDQAETVLMHLLRGAGPSGLRGMLPATPLTQYRLLPQAASRPEAADLVLIRPLLAFPREAIADYCRERGLESRFDLSNLDTTYFRNRLRHEVLPYLAGVNPGIAARLTHLAEVVRADYELLESVVAQSWEALRQESPAGAVVLDLREFRAAPLSLQRALIRKAVYTLRPGLRDVDFHHVENAVEIAGRGTTGMRATLPWGLELRISYDTVIIADAGAPVLPADRPWLLPETVLPLAESGITPLPEGWQIEAEAPAAWDYAAVRSNRDPWTAWIDAAAWIDPVVLRTRRLGDRWRPQGLGAEVNLGDFLVNARVPRSWRDSLPLLEAGGQLLWVVGVRLGEAALVRPESRRVVRLRVTRRDRD